MNYYCWFEVVGFDDTSDFQVKDENSGLNDSNHCNAHFKFKKHTEIWWIIGTWNLGLLTHS